MFPLNPDVVEEFRDLNKLKLLMIKRSAQEESEVRSRNIPPLPDIFKQSLLHEIRSEMLQRSGSNPLSMSTGLNGSTSGLTRSSVGIEGDIDPEVGSKRKFPSSTPPGSPAPPSKIARLNSSSSMQRTGSENSLFGSTLLRSSSPNPNLLNSVNGTNIAVPAPINIAKLETRLVQLEVEQVKLINELSQMKAHISELQCICKQHIPQQQQQQIITPTKNNVNTLTPSNPLGQASNSIPRSSTPTLPTLSTTPSSSSSS
eukprot:TRINITY_DN2881_c0_g1_i1.p1 TRINITY_DN2881_c0_g1~~TRINITY_DN2881_c0_g1_i1.p1  ORF type:complete len:258 (-),score=74.36 TRINITY_DN2881_c0_g1_i1:303-1076(-)